MSRLKLEAHNFDTRRVTAMPHLNFQSHTRKKRTKTVPHKAKKKGLQASKNTPQASMPISLSLSNTPSFSIVFWKNWIDSILALPAKDLPTNQDHQKQDHHINHHCIGPHIDGRTVIIF